MSGILSTELLSCVLLDIDTNIKKAQDARQRDLKTIEDKTCPLFLNGFCKEQSCPYRHSRGVDGEVCKHWIRGLCKRGDECEYLHIYDMARMPECMFYQTTGECVKGDDCPFLHLDKEHTKAICPWYRRGFCRNGSNCRGLHKREEICLKYLAGFCPDGPDCSAVHPKFDIKINEDVQLKQELERARAENSSASGQKLVICHRCHEKGHYANNCPRSTNNNNNGPHGAKSQPAGDHHNNTNNAWSNFTGGHNPNKRQRQM